VDLKEIKTDPALLEQGGWVSDIPGMGDLELQVRPLSNPKYQRLQSKLIQALPRAKRVGGRPDEDEQDRIISTCLLNTVLLGWRNLKDGGEEVEFTPDMARMLILQPEFRDFRDAVLYASGVVSDNRVADQEDAAKNS
jgi:hypothetical protein